MVIKLTQLKQILTKFNCIFTLGIQGIRLSVVDRGELPNARLVTSIVHRDFDHPDNELTILIMSWGQFIDHDVALGAPPRGKLFYFTF